jgi:FkbM family methyltransferase
MGSLVLAKEIAIRTGLYKPARALHRSLVPSERRRFNAHKALFTHFVKPGDLAFDVGANIGERTQILLSIGATVVAFEPQPSCAREILARDNGRLTVIPKAVGATEGTAILHTPNRQKGDQFASLKQNWAARAGDTSRLSVPVTTLNKAIEQFGLPVFCKIDVEGFEVQVLRGLSKPIPALSLEYTTYDDGPATVAEYLGRLSTLGRYEVNLIAEDDAKFVLPAWLPPKDFLLSFPRCVRGIGWGDMFVRQRSDAL